MPNQRIFDLLNKPVANNTKNGFDLGAFAGYSTKLGQVKPLEYFHTVPDGKYRISVDELTHTEPFITDPFVRLSKHIECVFVPYSQLWHGFSQYIGHSNDPQSSYEQGHNFVPCFSLGNMLDRIWKSINTETSQITTDLHGYPIQETALSLLDMLGYGAHPLYNMTDNARTEYINALKTRYVNAWALLAYNKIWNSLLRDSQHTSPLNPAIFNADRVPCTTEQTCIMDNYYTDAELLELVTIKYRKLKRDLFTSSLTSRQFGATELVTLDFDLSSAVIIGDGSTIGSVDGSSIYVGNQFQFNDDLNDSFKGLVLKRNESDYRVGTAGVDNSGNFVPLADITFSNYSSVISDTGVLNGLSVSGSGSGSFDVYTLLTAQLMQKWREQIQRAGNRTDDRINAVYGRKPAFDAKNEPYVIGSTSYNIAANQVTSTGEGATTKLGDIAAKGIGYSERNYFEFNASEFGIILVYTYLLPENNYLAPIDKLNTLIEPFDYFTPQIENLGLEPIESIFKKTVYYNDVEDKYFKDIEDTIEGYAARYWYYKTKVNKVHLGFQHGVENSKWIPQFTRSQGGVSVRNPYYVSPNEFDSVFGTVTDYHLDTDQFICAVKVNCDSVLPMSELGLPRW